MGLNSVCSCKQLKSSSTKLQNLKSLTARKPYFPRGRNSALRIGSVEMSSFTTITSDLTNTKIKALVNTISTRTINISMVTLAFWFMMFFPLQMVGHLLFHSFYDKWDLYVFIKSTFDS